MFELRSYQREAVDETINGLKNRPGNPLIAMPTGVGKSLVIGELIREMQTSYPAMRTCMLTHSSELVKQNFSKLVSLYPNGQFGIFSASLGKKQPDAPVVLATVQSVASTIKRKGNLFGTRHLCIVDEAHLIAPGGTTNYQRVFEAWRAEYETMKVVGLTATPYRQKGGLLYGDGQLFDYLSYDITGINAFSQLISDNYLVRPFSIDTGTEVDLSGVKIQAGDFNQTQVAEAVGNEKLLQDAVIETIKRGHDRKSWLFFVSGIENAIKVNDMLCQFGIASACVHSKQTSEENDRNIANHKTGSLRCLVNANMLTTGYDAPQIDLICMLRPTQSVSLHVQMIGRGTRPSERKKDCLCLDFAGNTKRLGPIDSPRIPGRPQKGKPSDPPMKVCDNCGAINYAAARKCVLCGEEFPIRISREPDNTPLIAGGPKVIEYLAPRRIIYSSHMSKTGNACLRVDYHVGNKCVTDYIAWENPKVAWKVNLWWSNRFPTTPRPKYLKDAIQVLHNMVYILEPVGIEVHMNYYFKGRFFPKLERELWNKPGKTEYEIAA